MTKLIRKNVLGSPRDSDEALGAVMDRGGFLLVARAAVLTVVSPGAIAP